MFENDVDLKKECLNNLSKIINHNVIKKQQIHNNDLNILSRLSDWYVYIYYNIIDNINT